MKVRLDKMDVKAERKLEREGVFVYVSFYPDSHVFFPSHMLNANERS